MDPLTHAVLGGAISHALFHRRLGRSAWKVGAVAGVLPDADGFIVLVADPLTYMEYHRHFTHALVFIPVGGLVAALPWIARRRHRPQWPAFWLAALLAYLSHSLLDAATGYGTQLLWPFSQLRVAWNAVAIVDPLVTLPLVAGLAIAVWQRRSRPAALALGWCLLYLGLGVVQRERVLEAQARLADARGHALQQGNAYPTLFNNRVWRSVYLAGDSIHADQVLVRWLGDAAWSGGNGLPRISADSLAPTKRADPRVRHQFGRFEWFADGWVARDPRDPTLLGDMRYSMDTGAFRPLWGVRLHPPPAASAEWVTQRRVEDIDWRTTWAEITGRDPAYRPVP